MKTKRRTRNCDFGLELEEVKVSVAGNYAEELLYNQGDFSK